MNTNQIQHHGVLGMKWGVRRYQNKDGTRIKLKNKKKVLKLANKETQMIDRLNKKVEKIASKNFVEEKGIDAATRNKINKIITEQSKQIDLIAKKIDKLEEEDRDRLRLKGIKTYEQAKDINMNEEDLNYIWWVTRPKEKGVATI